jgi:hypothetical protein
VHGGRVADREPDRDHDGAGSAEEGDGGVQTGDPRGAASSYLAHNSFRSHRIKVGAGPARSAHHGGLWNLRVSSQDAEDGVAALSQLIGRAEAVHKTDRHGGTWKIPSRSGEPSAYPGQTNSPRPNSAHDHRPRGRRGCRRRRSHRCPRGPSPRRQRGRWHRRGIGLARFERWHGQLAKADLAPASPPPALLRRRPQ